MTEIKFKIYPEDYTEDYSPEENRNYQIEITENGEYAGRLVIRKNKLVLSERGLVGFQNLIAGLKEGKLKIRYGKFEVERSKEKISAPIDCKQAAKLGLQQTGELEFEVSQISESNFIIYETRDE